MSIKKIISNIFSIISIIISLCISIIILNISLKFLTFVKISSIVYFWPIYICPIGIILSIVSFFIDKNKLSYVGFVLNLILIILQLLFMIIGLRYVGH